MWAEIKSPKSMVSPGLGKSLEGKAEDLLGEGQGQGGKHTTVKATKQKRRQHDRHGGEKRQTHYPHCILGKSAP